MRPWILLLPLLLVACTPTTGGLDQETQPDYNPAATTALARTTLGRLQAPSFQNDLEYCGYLGLDSAGTLRATQATPGDAASCMANDPPADWILVASYHTHGAYGAGYDSEVPSDSDIEGDHTEGVNGYVATPGGRFWLIDGDAQTATLICGPGCLAQDPNYRSEGPVANRYALSELRAR